MRLPPIRPVSQTDIYVRGDVTLHEKAVVASGVILQAAPNHRIIIGEGVCLGMGVVIRATGGDIEIGDGAVLGAGVLVIGCGKIGENVCIGAASTLMNVSVEEMRVIPSGSLLGDTSRSVGVAPVAEFQEIPTVNSNGSHPGADPWETEEKPAETPKLNHPPASEVVGQMYINQLLLKLFPEREAFKRSQDNRTQE